MKSVVFDRSQRGPVCVKTFPEVSRQLAHYHLRCLEALGLIEVAGEISWDGEGRNLTVFVAAGASYRPNQLKHDVLVQIVANRFGLPYTLERDGEVNADARLFAGDAVIHLEVETGSVPAATVEDERYPVYAERDKLVIWLAAGLWRTHAERHAESLRERGESIAHCALWTTLAAVLEHGREAVLKNYADKTTTLAEVLTKLGGASNGKKGESPRGNR